MSVNARIYNNFTNQNELMKFANCFIKKRTESLERDITYCLKEEPYAPFPAILYCFSTIDLLGALYSGNATRGHTTVNSKKYMKDFMKYKVDDCGFLMDLFRHKIVHLAQPKAFVEKDIGGKPSIICWRYFHNSKDNHLKLEKLPTDSKVPTPFGIVTCDYIFNISIFHFMKDIKESAEGQPNGYLTQLEKSTDLQNNFVSAIADSYNPRE